MIAAPAPHYAGIVSRGMAFAVDALAAVTLSTVGLQTASAVLSVFDSNRDHGAEALGFLLGVPLVFVGYCAGFWALFGRTPGMMLLGLRVVSVDGQPPGAAQSVVRAFGYWLSAILFLGFIWIGIDRRSQGFHDKLARTFVVYDWERDAD